MKITAKQKEILNFLTENEEEIKKLKTIATVNLSNLKIGDSVTVAGISWSKFAEDENGNSMMLADEAVCKMAFGKNNDWRESDVRNKCKEIAKKLKKELGDDAVVTFETDLFSHDGFRDYGKVQDDVALLTYDLYRNNRENIELFDSWYWLATPDSTPSGYGSGDVLCVSAGGDVDYGWGNGVGAARPFFILQS